jgi:hypothetical protein
LLKSIFIDLYLSLSETCKVHFELIEVSVETSDSLSVKENSISFDKTSPSLYDGAITYNFKLMEFELKVPMLAIVCGFEKIIPRSGVSVIEFELDKEDQSQSYFTKFKINQLLETS